MDISMNSGKTKSNYNSAKKWQIGLFTLNNTASNTAFFLMFFYAFFTQNVLGLSAAVVGAIAMAMRMFDGVTDPIIGFMLDKTDGKFGKFRPFMLGGNIVLFITVLAIYRTPAEWALQTKYIYTSVMYALFVIGYTFQTCCTKGAQAALTNDPKQRPMFTLFDSIYNIILFNGGTYIIMSLMAPKYPANINDPALWKTVSIMFMIASFIFTVLAVIGIWEKDRTEHFGLGQNAVKIKFKDTIDVIKNNRPTTIAAMATCPIRLRKIYFMDHLTDYNLVPIPKALLRFQTRPQLVKLFTLKLYKIPAGL
jgi:Na+/melibiose symporter-like transporter